VRQERQHSPRRVALPGILVLLGLRLCLRLGLRQCLLLLLLLLLILLILRVLLILWLAWLLQRPWVFDAFDGDLGAVFLRVTDPVSIVPDESRQFSAYAREGRWCRGQEAGRDDCGAGRGEGRDLPEASVVDFVVDVDGAGPGSSTPYIDSQNIRGHGRRE
jgi:hypothetical protein